MKIHISIDSRKILIHLLVVTVAKLRHVQVLGDLLHGGESGIYGNSAYSGQKSLKKSTLLQRRISYTNGFVVTIH